MAQGVDETLRDGHFELMVSIGIGLTVSGNRQSDESAL